MSTSFSYGDRGCACARYTCVGCSVYEANKQDEIPLNLSDRIGSRIVSSTYVHSSIPAIRVESATDYCSICGGYGYQLICPECAKRIKKLIYPRYEKDMEGSK